MIKEVEISKEPKAEKVKGEYVEFGMSLPLQMLFDDFLTFVSKTDFET